MIRQKYIFLFLITLAICACGKKTQISPNCSLVKTQNNDYMLIIEWEFVHDTVHQVELIGKNEQWVYAYGKYKNKKAWVHIWDGVVVKVYERNGEKDAPSYYGRKDATMYTPEEAIEKLKQ